MNIKNIRKVIASVLVFALSVGYMPISIFASTINADYSGFTLNDIVYDTNYQYTPLDFGQENTTLSWNDVNFTDETGASYDSRYYIAKRRVDPNDPANTTGEYSWALTGNYETEPVKVLNVYSGSGNQLQYWTEELTRAFPQISLPMQVSQVSIDTFNRVPSEYLWKDSSGNYNYDVIVFGFSPTYSADLSYDARVAVDDFLEYCEAKDSGGAVFGHGIANKSNFRQIIEGNSDIRVTQSVGDDYTEVVANHDTDFTTYPFDVAHYNEYIGDIVVPPTSSDVDADNQYVQMVNGGSGSQDYMIADDRIAIIQVDGTDHQGTNAEHAMIANAIYGLTDMHTSNKGVDRIVDKDKPYGPEVNLVENDRIRFTAEDTGTTYKYRIIAEPIDAQTSVLDNFRKIKPMLDETDETTQIMVDDDVYVLSNAKYTHEEISEPKGSLGYETDRNGFEYYIDSNPYGEYKTEGTKFATYDQTYDQTALKGIIGEGNYLHVWTYDNANNVSVDGPTVDVLTETPVMGTDFVYTKNQNGITNVSFVAPKADATVNYLDKSTNEILLPAETTEKTVGDTYKPLKKFISGYRYNSSMPSDQIVVSETTDNTITHYYDKVFTNNVYTVTHNSSGDVVETKQVDTITAVENSDVTINAPDITDYTLYGYGLGTDSSSVTPQTSYSFNMVWNSDEDIYLHYEPIEKNVTVNIERDNRDGTTTDLFSFDAGSYPVNEEATILGTDIASHFTSGDEDYYINADELNKDRSIYVTSDSDNIITVTLIPRQKTVVYSGLDFDGVAPNETQTLEESTYTYGTTSDIYDGGKTLDITPTDSDFSGWTPIKYDTRNIDFSSDSGRVTFIEYYKGTLPTYPYNYTVEYYDEATGVSGLIPTVTETNVMTVPAEIVIPDIPNYEFDYVTVDGSEVEVSELYKYVPQFNEDGTLAKTDYDVDVYYKPYIEVTFKEHLQNTDGTMSLPISTNKKEVLYGENVSFLKSKHNSAYDETIENGQNNEITVTDSNITSEETIDLYYRPMTYDLTVNILNGSQDTVQILEPAKTYENVLITDSVAFDVEPIISGYDYVGTMANDEATPFEPTEDLNIVFNESGEVAEGTYELDVVYKHEAEAQVTYILSDNTGLSSETTEPIDTYVGDKVEFVVPDLEKYEIVEVYLDGVVYRPDENDEMNLTVTKPYEHLYAVYREIPKLKVTTNVSPEGSGEVVGNTDEAGEQNVYVSGDTVTLKAVAKPGYKFTGWTLPSDVTPFYGTSTTSPRLAFAMPDHDIEVTANFVEVATGEHTVTTSVSPTNSGVVTMNGENISTSQFKAGETVTLNATPNSGYDFVNWTNYGDLEILNNAGTDASKTPSIYFVMPDSDVNITAVFSKDDDNSGGGGDNGGGDPDPEEPDPEEPDTIEPIDPTRPVNPGDIIAIIEDPIQSAVRAYIPYIQGYPEGDVRPEGYITRAEVMQAMYNLYGYGLFVDGYDHMESLDKFSDVSEDDWYAEGIAFCVDLGVVNGYPDGTIRPDEPISRAELATILSKFMLDDEYADSGLSDVDGHWAEDAINELYDNGIINGYPDGTFAPQRNTSRAEFVTMVNRLVHRPDDYYEYVSYPDLPETHWAYDDMMNASNGAVIGQNLDQEVIDAINDRLDN